MLYVAADFGDMDSQRSFFVESGRRATRYIRVVRIGFVKPFDGRDVVVERPLEVNYVTFQHLAPPTPHIILRAKVVGRRLAVNYVTVQHLAPSGGQLRFTGRFQVASESRVVRAFIRVTLISSSMTTLYRTVTLLPLLYTILTASSDLLLSEALISNRTLGPDSTTFEVCWVQPDQLFELLYPC